MSTLAAGIVLFVVLVLLSDVNRDIKLMKKKDIDDPTDTYLND